MVRWRLPAAAAVIGAFGLAAGALSPGHDAGAAAGLVKGWNNVAYLGSSGPPSEALASIDGKYSTVYRWDAEAGIYEVYAPGVPGFANTLTQLNYGDAIWLHLTADSAQLATGRSGSISISASTFVPESDLAIYEKTYNQLHPVGTDDASKRYYANVTLPDGVTITSMTAAYTATSGTVHVRLDYTPLTNGTDAGKVYKLVEVLSSDGPSPRTAQAFAHTVDNEANVYFLIVDLTGGPNTKLHGVSIAYTD
ncbi:MAG: hypothetical protein Kow0010_03970 [Dehalococcoidia bacterium]